MLEGFVNTLAKVFGNKHDRDVKEIQPIVDEILEIEKSLGTISDNELRAKTAEFKKRIQDKISEDEKQKLELKQKAESLEDSLVKEKEETYAEIDKLEKEILDDITKELQDILPEAFAVMRETARRLKEKDGLEVNTTDWDRERAAKYGHIKINGEKTFWSSTWKVRGHDVKWDMVPYPVQLIGGAVLHSGKIAEMATGEGKTLVAILPVYLNALAGRGVHMVTVNDYLARRDSEWMGPLFEFQGLRVDCIDKHEPNSPERKNAYPGGYYIRYQ